MADAFGNESNSGPLKDQDQSISDCYMYSRMYTLTAQLLQCYMLVRLAGCVYAPGVALIRSPAMRQPGVTKW